MPVVMQRDLSCGLQHCFADLECFCSYGQPYIQIATGPFPSASNIQARPGTLSNFYWLTSLVLSAGVGRIYHQQRCSSLLCSLHTPQPLCLLVWKMLCKAAGAGEALPMSSIAKVLVRRMHIYRICSN